VRVLVKAQYSLADLAATIADVLVAPASPPRPSDPA